MSPPATELHQLAPAAFLDEVHSFEFWFKSVEGYLSGRDFGHKPEAEDAPMEQAEREHLITVLCNYCVGETAALEGASGLVSIAPSRQAQIFLATQVVDEARHLEVFLRRLLDLGVANPEAEIRRRATRSVWHFRSRLLALVAACDWEAALFAQNVLLEAMEFTVFQAHARRADPVTREVLEGVVKDERRHMGFGENDLGRRLAATPHIRTRLEQVQRELNPLILETFEETLAELGVPRDRRLELGRTYLAAVGRLGLSA